jgi:hypothetical protein
MPSTKSSVMVALALAHTYQDVSPNSCWWREDSNVIADNLDILESAQPVVVAVAAPVMHGRGPCLSVLSRRTLERLR